jgi:hypothetical protein
MESSHRNENEYESPDLEREKPVDSTSSDLEQNPPSEQLTEAEEEQQESFKDPNLVRTAAPPNPKQ